MEWQISSQRYALEKLTFFRSVLFFSGIILENGRKKEVFLRDIWPSRDEIAALEEKFILPQFYKQAYENIRLGSEQWRNIVCSEELLYPWDPKSTYIKKAPFFDEMVCGVLIIVFCNA